MNMRHALVRWIIALAFFFGVIYLTEHFIDSQFGVWVSLYRYAHIMLFSAIYLLARYSRRISYLLWERNSLAASGLVLGGKLVGRWLTIAILACMGLRFDLSLQAYTRTLIIFLLPRDLVMDLPLISHVVYTTGFWGFVIAGGAIALTAVGITLSIVLGGSKKQRENKKSEHI